MRRAIEDPSDHCLRRRWTTRKDDEQPINLGARHQVRHLIESSTADRSELAT